MSPARPLGERGGASRAVSLQDAATMPTELDEHPPAVPDELPRRAACSVRPPVGRRSPLAMRVLHIGWGYKPWWSDGGLIAYTEAILAGQVQRGHEVHYLFGGRELPLLRQPRLHRWTRGGVRMLEVLNAGAPAAAGRGIREPALELDDADTERLVAGQLERVRPDIVHVQTFEGLPSSVIDVIGAMALPSVMTLEDYHPLCPTVKLWDHTKQVCRRLQPGATCVTCCAEGMSGTELQRWMTRKMTITTVRERIPHPLAPRLVDGIWRRLPPAPTGPVPVAPAAEYDRRRTVNVRRLSQLDALIAMSPGVAEVYSARGVPADRIRVQRLTLPHIEQLPARRRVVERPPVRFATLNGAASTAKGADVLLEAVRRLGTAGLGDRYRLGVHGGVADHVEAALGQDASVEIWGPYLSQDLERLLVDAHIGIVPSVWEEAYGYVGAEFIASGMPVISNARGGLPFHTLPGKTGWLNASANGAGLAAIMAEIIRRPEEVQRMSDLVLAHRDEIVIPFATHLDELDATYAELVEGCRAGSRAHR